MTAPTTPKEKSPNRKKIIISVLMVVVVLAIVAVAAFFSKFQGIFNSVWILFEHMIKIIVEAKASWLVSYGRFLSESQKHNIKTRLL